ncbi:MAG: hypothetical protein NTX29_11700 [Actinobacteria bacterium]|nr:hypothetical protein [Actinomycetota bacterium]
MTTASQRWTSLLRRADRRLAHRSTRAASAWGGARPFACAMTGGSATCTGSVLAFTEYLHEQGIGVVWAYQQDRGQVPRWATAVRAGSARHRYLAARAQWWVTDGLPMRIVDPDTKGGALERGPDTRLLVFVEPTVDRVGADLVDWPLLSPGQRRPHQLPGEARADLVAVPSRDVGDRAARALGITCPSVVAVPRAERLPSRDQARARLGIEPRIGVIGFLRLREAHFPVAEVAVELPGHVLLTLAADSVDAANVEVATGPADLVAACDLLVTDTSPWAPIAARAGRPVVIFAPDLRDLLSRGPGLYVRWPRDLPGPLAGSATDVVRAVLESESSGWSVAAGSAVGHERFAALIDEPAESCARVLQAMRGDR